MPRIFASCWTSYSYGFGKVFEVFRTELNDPSSVYKRVGLFDLDGNAGWTVEDVPCSNRVAFIVNCCSADSIRSAGLILASWLLSIGVENAEVLCLGLVSVVVFTLVLPLFRATGGILLQMAPPSIPTTAFSKCLRQISAREDVLEVSQARFWELVPSRVIGSLSMQVKKGVDDRPILEFVHRLYHDFRVQYLTVQIDYA
ncbi:Metal tolerance protein C2 [Lathyrus oleraceus]|uniref:Metal tolerance protein C2 n=1 Tax=Pisum sativum TaxID=3888 RepID=A0A9D5A9L7_PEA|nr:Metal tolerance protein C2 [Pisum sativum]